MGQPEKGVKHRRGRWLVFHVPGVTLTKSPAATMDSAGIGAENRCLKFATAVGRRIGSKREKDKTGTQLVRGLAGRYMGLYLWELGERSVQSIIGATEKRREKLWSVLDIVDGDMGIYAEKRMRLRSLSGSLTPFFLFLSKIGDISYVRIADILYAKHLPS